MNKPESIVFDKPQVFLTEDGETLGCMEYQSETRLLNIKYSGSAAVEHVVRASDSVISEITKSEALYVYQDLRELVGDWFEGWQQAARRHHRALQTSRLQHWVIVLPHDSAALSAAASIIQKVQGNKNRPYQTHFYRDEAEAIYYLYQHIGSI